MKIFALFFSIFSIFSGLKAQTVSDTKEKIVTIFPDLDSVQIATLIRSENGLLADNNGFSLHGTQAKFIGNIRLSSKGLRGNGQIRYLNTTVLSEDFIFHKDSIIGRGRSGQMEGTNINDIDFPDCHIGAYAMKWNPKKKSMNIINAKGFPFKLYNNSISLEGLISLSPKGLAGRGYIENNYERIESERYKFSKSGFNGRRSFYEAKSKVPTKPWFICRNVFFEYLHENDQRKFAPEVQEFNSFFFPFSTPNLLKFTGDSAYLFINSKSVVLEKRNQFIRFIWSEESEQYSIDSSLTNIYFRRLENKADKELNSSKILEVNSKEKQTEVIVPVSPNAATKNSHLVFPALKNVGEGGIAVIIGNEEYEGGFPNLQFAKNDMKLMTELLTKSFGFLNKNIIYLPNVTKTKMDSWFGTKDDFQQQLYNKIVPGVTKEIWLYYVGHAGPNGNNPDDKRAFLILKDTEKSAVSATGYPLETLYKNLDRLPVEKVTVVIDACFSGHALGYNNAATINIEDVLKKAPTLLQKGVVLTASENNQFAIRDETRKHGLFTYELVNAICNGKESDLNKDGKVSYEEIINKLNDPLKGVPAMARDQNKQQSPTVNGGLKSNTFFSIGH